jgi:carboxyl-terminal processing protease
MFRILWFVGLLCLPAATPWATETLKPAKLHSVEGQVIANLLRKYHYNHQKLDDAVSAEMLDLYIDRLDHSRVYFLASDIADFEKYRYTLDDNLIAGNVDVAFIIFNIVKARTQQRLAYVSDRLEQDSFDFSTAELFEIDRSEAPWAQDLDALQELWRKRLKTEALNLTLAGKAWPDVQKTLKRRYGNLERNINQYNSEDVFQSYMNALAEVFDPHTSYFSPISSDNFSIDMSLSLEGIGAQLISEDEYTKVMRILPGGPADRSKAIWANDRIVGVAQDSTGEMLDVIGMRLDEVVQKIRGPKGSLVRLEIIPAEATEDAETKTIELVRDKIVLEERAAKSDTVEFDHQGRQYKLGVIEIPAFYIDMEAQRRGDPEYKSTTRDVRRLIGELESAGVNGIIVDLRRNGGGSLQEAIELTGLFIKEGPVVQVKSSTGSKRVEYDPDENLVYDGPLAVLVDRFSASASEIFSSALQDYGRGLVVGNQTYGKGTVQNLLDLDRFPPLASEKAGQLKITIAKFYRITGGTTQHRGVLPDIDFPSIYSEMDYGENKEKHALPWSEISPTMFKADDRVSRYLSTLRQNSKERIQNNIEFSFIVEDIDEYRQERDQNTISLNKTERERERERDEERKLARINLRRAAKGTPPLHKGDKVPDEDQAPDAVLAETRMILADFIALSNPEKHLELTKAKTGADKTVKPAGEGQSSVSGKNQ